MQDPMNLEPSDSARDTTKDIRKDTGENGGLPPQEPGAHEPETAAGTATVYQSIDTGVDDPNVTLDPAATRPSGTLKTSQVLNDALARPAMTSGRFKVLHVHAKGGLGQVSLAVDDELRRTVALKEIQSQFADDLDARARFIREAEITGRLEHPGIVPVYGFGVSPDGRPYYAMRFIEGRSLKDAIDEFHRLPNDASDTSLKFRELLRRIVDVCNTIYYAHSRRVLHRDIKPANIMVGEYGETLVVDWGLAKSIDEEEFIPDEKRRVQRSRKSAVDTDTMDGVAIGTPQYMSPEQAVGHLSEVGPLSDVYSLGATLYHLLVGQPAFVGRDLSKLLSGVRTGTFPAPRAARPDVPSPLESICMKAMALCPKDRYSSAQEIALEIERWLADEPVLCHGEGLAERWYRRMRRHRSWVMGVATMVPVLLLVMSLAAYFVNSERLKVVTQRDIAVAAGQREAKQRLLAEASETRAIKQEALAQSAAKAAGDSLADLLISNAEQAQMDRDASGAALWLHRALPLVEEYQHENANVHRIRLGRLLRQLPRPVRVQMLPKDLRSLAVVHRLSPDGKMLILTGALPGAAGFAIQSGEVAWSSLPQNDMIPFVCFSPDNKRLLTGGSESLIRIWDIATGQLIGDPISTQGQLSEGRGISDIPLAINTSGKYIAATTTTPNESVQVEWFSLKNTATPLSPIVSEETITSLEFHPHRDELMVVTKAGVWFYDPLTETEVGEPIRQPDLWASHYSPDGKIIATTNSSGYAQLWDSEKRKPLGELLDHRGPVTEAVFSPTNKTVVTLSADQSARVWDVASGKAVGVPLEHGVRPLFARVRADGQAVATIGLDHSVRAWDVPTGRLIAGPWYHSVAPDVRFVDDQLIIAVDGRCVSWDLGRSQQDSTIAFKYPLAESATLPSAYFAGTSDKVVIVRENSICLCDPSVRPISVTTLAPKAKILMHALSSNGDILATLSETNELQRWRLGDDPRLLNTIQFETVVSHLRLDHDGKQLLVANPSGGAQVWNMESGSVQGGELLHDALVRDSDFSPDGKHVVTGSDDKLLRLWEAGSGKLIGQPLLVGEREAAAMAVSCVRFHPSGNAVAAGSDSDEVVVWEPFAEPIELRRFRLKGAVSEVQFSRDGQLLGAAGFANTVLVWDWRKGAQPLASLPSPFISQMKFAPNPKLIATASIATVSLWETNTGRLVGPSDQLRTRGLNIDSQQRWLMASGDKVRLWNIQPEPREAKALEPLMRVLSMRKFSEQGSAELLSSEEFNEEYLEANKRYPEEFEFIPRLEVILQDG